MNYADLPVGSHRKAEESDPYLAQLRLIYQEQKALVSKTALLNLLLLLAMVCCLWGGARWLLSKYPPPDSPEIPRAVDFRN